MAYSASDLALADVHIAQGERHILQQEELIERMRLRGLPTDAAEDLLRAFRATLRQHREHRAIIERAMRAEG